MSRTLPWNDWQFWVVTLAAAIAAGVILRTVWPPGVWPRTQRRGQRKAVSLTISAEKPAEVTPPAQHK